MRNILFALLAITALSSAALGDAYPRVTPTTLVGLAKLPAIYATTTSAYQWVSDASVTAMYDWNSTASQTNYPCSTPIGGVGFIAADYSYVCSSDTPYLTTGRWIRASTAASSINGVIPPLNGGTPEIHSGAFGVLPGIQTPANDARIDAMLTAANSQLSGATGSVVSWAKEQPCIVWDSYPSGFNTHYYYGGNGVSFSSGNAFCMTATPNTVSISILNNVWLYTNSNPMIWTYLNGLHIIGGKGLFHYTNSGTQVGGFHPIQNMIFEGYTVAAYSNESTDSPGLRDINNQYFGTSTSFGRVWMGLNDDSVIQGNLSVKNLFDLKIGYCGSSGSIHISDNDWYSYGTDVHQAAIWNVPCTNPAVSGSVLLEHNRFGNEGLNPAIPRILFAIEDNSSGADHSTRRPLLVYQPYGTYFVNNWTFSHNGVSGTDSETAPFIDSYIDDVAGFLWEPNNLLIGGLYTSLIKFEGAHTLIYPNVNWSISLGCVGSENGGLQFQNGIVIDSSGPISPGVIKDECGYMSFDPTIMRRGGSADELGSAVLVSAAGYGDMLLGSATSVAVSDGENAGNTAAEVTVTNNEALSDTYVNLTNITAGAPARIYASIKQGASLPGGHLTVRLFNYTGGTYQAYEQNIPLTGKWQPINIEAPIPQNACATCWTLSFGLSDYASGVRTKFQIAHVRVEQGTTKLNYGNLSISGVNAGRWNGYHVIMKPTQTDQTTWTHDWYDAGNNILRQKFGSYPSSATDGNQASVPSFAVGSLPLASTFGVGIAVITDNNGACAYGGTPASGGSTKCLVFSNASSWTIH